ncbi:MAG TPA: hypothetical protein VGR35_17265, partial [Tepidisphaeraceae bacterium]|nr:hypothetical protein [Tepidisphaeraceae bacterium]
EARRHEGGEEAKSGEVNSLDPSTPFPTLRASVPRDPAQREVVLRASPRASPLGYIISRDRYLKRDELGVIYQLCVAPGDQRKLVGASLVKAVFERAAYGCRLFCCWCAQDLDANYFWESLGFVPIAFRAGSTGKKRVHIFWQRRIVEGDGTPWWYPFKTDSGAIRADRIVFPIPPGVHWSEVKPVVVPSDRSVGILPEPGAAPAPKGSRTTAKPRKQPEPVIAAAACASPARHAITRSSALRFGPPVLPAPSVPAAPTAMARAEQPPREKKPAVRIDPAYLKAARELRDRYLEHVNGERVNEAPHALASSGKYDVSRALAAPAVMAPTAMHIDARPLRQLPSAA